MCEALGEHSAGNESGPQETSYDPGKLREGRSKQRAGHT